MQIFCEDRSELQKRLTAGPPGLRVYVNPTACIQFTFRGTKNMTEAGAGLSVIPNFPRCHPLSVTGVQAAASRLRRQPQRDSKSPTTSAVTYFIALECSHHDIHWSSGGFDPKVVAVGGGPLLVSSTVHRLRDSFRRGWGRKIPLPCFSRGDRAQADLGNDILWNMYSHGSEIGSS